jgi:hypothetical protein
MADLAELGQPSAGATVDVRRAAVDRSGSRWRSQLLVAAVVATAASPVVVAAMSYVGDSWFPVGDWASLVFRTSQVGTADTPLIGAYTVKGWAHPGPLLYWLAAPLYRLTGGDPRSLAWTASAVNVIVVVAIAAVAWRRGRWPLLLGVMSFTAVLVHGIGPEFLTDLWNPYLPLMAFLLTILLVWDAALGRRRAVIEAVVPACFAMQCHLAFVSLVALLALWFVAWCRWWPRVLSADSTDDELPRPPWSAWLTAARGGLVIAVVLWLAPLVDALVDRHNPARIARSFVGDTARVGPFDAVGLVGRYVRPDGPWTGGAEPVRWFSVQGSGPLPLLAALAVLAACLGIARRRQFSDVAALSTLVLTLVVGAVPAASQFVMPAEPYLTQWLKIVGCLVWFTVAWTCWRLVDAERRSSAVRRLVAPGFGVALLLGGAASTWGPAASAEFPLPESGEVVESLAAQLRDLPRDEVIRVERRGEPWHIFTPGLINALIGDGYDIVTPDGASGLKWGHSYLWDKGDRYDRLLTVAVHNPGNLLRDAFGECANDPRVTLLASYDGLDPADRAWLDDANLRRLDHPDALSDDESRRADELEDGNLRVGVFEGPQVCAKDQMLRPTDPDGSPTG